MTRESQILDQLEDAQEDYEREQRLFRWMSSACLIGTMITVTVPFLLGYLHSIGADWGLGSVFIPIVSGVIALVAGIPAVMIYTEDLPEARKQLKKAQRAHRNHLLDDNPDSCAHTSLRNSRNWKRHDPF